MFSMSVVDEQLVVDFKSFHLFRAEKDLLIQRSKLLIYFSPEIITSVIVSARKKSRAWTETFWILSVVISDVEFNALSEQ